MLGGDVCVILQQNNWTSSGEESDGDDYQNEGGGRLCEAGGR